MLGIRFGYFVERLRGLFFSALSERAEDGSVRRVRREGPMNRNRRKLDPDDGLFRCGEHRPVPAALRLPYV